MRVCINSSKEQEGDNNKCHIDSQQQQCFQLVTINSKVMSTIASFINGRTNVPLCNAFEVGPVQCESHDDNSY